jgi:paraquat-inducible protein B
MSARPNPAAIGAFVVGAVALLLAALVIWGGTGLFRTRVHYVLFFDAAVTGLGKGAPVLARGVKVGEVTDIQIRWGTPMVAVYVELEPDNVKGATEAGPRQALERLVHEEGMRAQLRMQSFVTGVLYVALEPRPDTPIVLRGLDRSVPELPTIPTDIEVWTAKLERFAAKIDNLPIEDLFRSTIAAINDARGLVNKVGSQVDPTVAQLRTTLARLDAGLDAAHQLARDLDRRVDPLATQAEATLKTAQTVIGDMQPAIEDLRRLAAKLDAQADPLLTSIRSTSDTARATLEGAQLTLGGIDRTLEQDSPIGFELFQTLKELRAAAQSVRSLADYLERVPDAPLYGVRRPSPRGMTGNGE